MFQTTNQAPFIDGFVPHNHGSERSLTKSLWYPLRSNLFDPSFHSAPHHPPSGRAVPGYPGERTNKAAVMGCLTIGIYGLYMVCV